MLCFFFFFSSRRRHTRFDCDWSSDVCSSDLGGIIEQQEVHPARLPRIHAEIYTVAENVGTQRKAPTRIRYGCGWTDSYWRALVRGFGFCDIRPRLFEACA